MKKITSAIIVAIAVPTLLSGCVLADIVRKNEMSLSTPERKALAERRDAERSGQVRTASVEVPAPAPRADEGGRTVGPTSPPATERRPARVASVERPEPARPAPARTTPGPTSTQPESTVRPRVAGGDRLMGALMRSWNRIAAPNASSKDLFGVWPEDFDRRAPSVTELRKRSERT